MHHLTQQLLSVRYSCTAPGTQRLHVSITACFLKLSVGVSCIPITVIQNQPRLLHELIPRSSAMDCDFHRLPHQPSAHLCGIHAATHRGLICFRIAAAAAWRSPRSRWSSALWKACYALPSMNICRRVEGWRACTHGCCTKLSSEF